MGRSKKAISFDTPERGKVKVHSKTYGDHERAVRGSGKKIEVNSIMKENGRRMIGSNAPAKLIFDALKPFRENFKGGLFWQDLVKHFTKQLNKGEKYSVKGFSDLNINKNYPLSRMISLEAEVTLELPSLLLMIKIKSTVADRFLKRCPYVNGIQLTFIGLFPRRYLLLYHEYSRFRQFLSALLQGGRMPKWSGHRWKPGSNERHDNSNLTNVVIH